MSKRPNTNTVASIFATFGLVKINEELTARGSKPGESLELGATILAMGTASLDEFSVAVVNLSDGSVTGDELTELMLRAFPDNKITQRHGPHYRSLCNTGNVGGRWAVRATVAKHTKKAGAKASGMDLSTQTIDALNAMLAQVIGTPFEIIVKSELAKRAAPPVPVAEIKPVATPEQIAASKADEKAKIAALRAETRRKSDEARAAKA